jgi:phage-related protein
MSLIQAIPTIILSVADSVAANWPAFKQAFIDIFTNVRDNLPQILADLNTKLGQLVTELGTMIGTLTGEFIAAAKEWISAIWQSVQQWWPQFVQNVKSFVSDLPGNMTQALANISEVGMHIVQGIWNGIQAGWEWLKGLVANFASSLLDAAKGALGIKSPSREFAWIGEMVTAGLGQGLEETKPIEDAMSNMMDLTTGTLTPDLMLAGTVTGGGLIGQHGGNTIYNTFNIQGANGQDVYQIAIAVRDILTDEIEQTEAVYA